MMLVLARVRQFLPQIERSNAELLQRDPRSIDIEHVEESDEHVVEMASSRNLILLTLVSNNK
jgi:Co/Zn/Cd efflux system component